MIAINRTKLELKPHGHFATNAARFVYQSYQTGIETKFGMLGRIKWCAINRTKLELKRITSTARLSTSILSIVPNWNWNEDNRRQAGGTCGTINRTKLELKQLSFYFERLNFSPINRTKLELKQNYKLKPRRADRHYQSYQTGIETRKNTWKHCNSSIYQSYQTGIETTLKTTTIGGSTGYQSYQTGIETNCHSDIIIICFFLSIVPNWNWNKKW